MLRHLLLSAARTSPAARSLFGKSNAPSIFVPSYRMLSDLKDRTGRQRPKALWMAAVGAGLASVAWLTATCITVAIWALDPYSASSPSALDDDDVILLTHNLSVRNPANGECAETTVFFENGVLNSFICEDLAQQLKLEPINQYRYEYISFGNHEGSFISTTYMVQLKQQDGELVDLLVYSTPRMDAWVMNGVATGHHDEPNPTRRIVTPGITVGTDRFWDFVQARGPALPSGLWSIDTVFGRMATGAITAAPTSKTSTNHLLPA